MPLRLRLTLPAHDISTEYGHSEVCIEAGEGVRPSKTVADVICSGLRRRIDEGAVRDGVSIALEWCKQGSGMAGIWKQ